MEGVEDCVTESDSRRRGSLGYWDVHICKTFKLLGLDLLKKWFVRLDTSRMDMEMDSLFSSTSFIFDVLATCQMNLINNLFRFSMFFETLTLWIKINRQKINIHTEISLEQM